jgi:hypothetical protein
MSYYRLETLQVNNKNVKYGDNKVQTMIWVKERMNQRFIQLIIYVCDLEEHDEMYEWNQEQLIEFEGFAPLEQL